jgi:hypothetical protein
LSLFVGSAQCSPSQLTTHPSRASPNN